MALVARNQDGLRQAAKPLGDQGFVFAGDLLSAEIRRAAVEATLDRFGRVDVLVNCAGVGLYADTAEVPMEQARELFELNFFVPLEMARLCAPAMRRQGSGTIVNIGSIAGQFTLPWLTLYSASKSALAAMTDGLRMELRRDGIHAMTVHPAYVDTDFQSHAIAGAPPAAMRRSKPMLVSAEECAEAIVRGVERKASTVAVPSRAWMTVAAARVFPGLVERRLERMYRSGK